MKIIITLIVLIILLNTFKMLLFGGIFNIIILVLIVYAIYRMVKYFVNKFGI